LKDLLSIEIEEDKEEKEAWLRGLSREELLGIVSEKVREI
jgi:hypothetical protein